MSTDGDQSTNIAHLFQSEAASPAATPASPAAAEQPLPPELESQYQQLQPSFEVPHPQLAPGQEQPVPAAQPQLVPLAELIETRRRAQAAEEATRQTQQQVAQLNETLRRLTQPQQPQPQPIDPEIDPRGAFQALNANFNEQLLSNRLDMSEHFARQKYGDATVDAALQAAQQSGYAGSFINRRDAYGDMVAWHQGQLVRAEIGADPAAYRQKIATEIRAQLLAELKQGTPPPANLPPSLSTATKANSTPQVSGSDKDFFNEMMNRKRG